MMGNETTDDDNKNGSSSSSTAITAAAAAAAPAGTEQVTHFFCVCFSKVMMLSIFPPSFLVCLPRIRSYVLSFGCAFPT